MKTRIQFVVNERNKIESRIERRKVRRAYGKLEEISLYLDYHYDRLTWNNVLRIQRVLVLKEAEAIHELDLCNVSGAMALKVLLNIFFGD